MKIKTNYEEVEQLSFSITVLCQTILLEAQELECALNTLKKTFADDGIEEIDQCLDGIFLALDDSQEDMTGLVSLLYQHASALRDSK